MKHTINHIMTVGAACLLLAGCEAYEPGDAEATGGVPLQLGVVEKLATQSEVQTRATDGYEAITEENAQLGLFRKAADPYSALSNVKYVYTKPAGKETSEWAPEGGDANAVWLYISGNTDIAAYYPYNASLPLVESKENEGIINLSAAIRDADNPQDLWYDHCTADIRNNKKDLQLKQAYCRMQLTFLLDENVSYVVQPYLYKLTLEGGRAASNTTDGIFSTATLDLFQDPASAYSRDTKEYNAVNITANTYQLASTAETSTAKFDLMMIPAALSGDVKLTVSIGGASSTAKSMSVSIPANDFSDKLEAGKIYQITVTIKGTDIGEFSTVTTDWTPDISKGINFDNPSYN